MLGFIMLTAMKSNSKKNGYDSLPKIFLMCGKKKNGLGDDVELIRVIIDSNSKTAVSEFDGEGVVNHEVGNYHIYNLTITKSIENYYDTIDRELLLESLKRTMTGYSGIEYDEYHLILEE